MPRSRSALRLADVAELAGVSLATASRALAGRDGVSDKVAEHVRQVANQLGYVANMHARTLAGGSTSTVGLIVHEIGDPYFSEIASGVIRVAGERDLMVQICHSGRDPEKEFRQIQTIIAHRAGIIIVAGSGYCDPRLQARSKAALSAFQASGGRVSVIGRHHLTADAVLPDNEAAGRSAAEHLLSLGHRRIAVVSGPDSLTTVEDRLAGIAGAIQRGGLTWSDIPVIPTHFTRDSGLLATEQILRDHPETTAIIALTDAMAIGVLSALRAHGISVPDQISVVGLDDVSVAADLAPSLTTVRLPMAAMGELALAMALKPQSQRPRRKSTGHQLVVRDSTGPVPAG
ncbi:LacI family DNA-binding transcriptional regulator [Polymorphospora rubra]|uniref:LacI family DNA-binding transcriptional regulator n=1 Tax=Polymorphospora rubra TaxID=338584 RepID=UPI0033DC4104